MYDYQFKFKLNRLCHFSDDTKLGGKQLIKKVLCTYPNTTQKSDHQADLYKIKIYIFEMLLDKSYFSFLINNQ